jgi:hypothetical protein
MYVTMSWLEIVDQEKKEQGKVTYIQLLPEQ